MQHAERHDDIETAVIEREVLAASVVQDGPERLSVFAEFADRLYALNPKFRASLFVGIGRRGQFRIRRPERSEPGQHEAVLSRTLARRSARHLAGHASTRRRVPSRRNSPADAAVMWSTLALLFPSTKRAERSGQ